ncbi:MAG: hypothetical protein RIA09_15700 [Hoeflea sp.]|uniref:hypothetical protein n=1 Tax=Hoeflea sp. TaxID=1940281 RepID=UPI0032ECC5AF
MIWVWEIFTLLNRQRQVGSNGPQPFSIQDIHSICTLRDIQRSDDIELLLLAIPELDAMVLKDHYDRVEKQMKKEKNKYKKPPTRR